MPSLDKLFPQVGKQIDFQHKVFLTWFCMCKHKGPPEGLFNPFEIRNIELWSFYHTLFYVTSFSNFSNSTVMTYIMVESDKKICIPYIRKRKVNWGFFLNFKDLFLCVLVRNLLFSFGNLLITSRTTLRQKIDNFKASATRTSRD